MRLQGAEVYLFYLLVNQTAEVALSQHILPILGNSIACSGG